MYRHTSAVLAVSLRLLKVPLTKMPFIQFLSRFAIVATRRVGTGNDERTYAKRRILKVALNLDS
jgi:hypothetical protein